MWNNVYTRLLAMVLIGLVAVSTVSAQTNDEGVSLGFSSEEFTVTVSGKVTDQTTNQPIPNALVRGHIVVWRHEGPDLFDRCPYREATTDANGVYQLNFVTPLTTSGPMKGKDGACVYVSAPGHETKPRYVSPSVKPEKTLFEGVDVALGPGKCLKGQAVDEDRRPIAGALVRVQNGMNGDWNHFGSLGNTSTDQNGQFEVWISNQDNKDFQDSPPWLQVWKQGKGAAIFWDLFDKEDMGTLIIPKLGSIKGWVLDVDGAGVPNCEVLAERFPVEFADSTVTNSQGEYVLNGIPGKATLVAFFQRKNSLKHVSQELLQTRVYARLDPEMNLRDAPQCAIIAKEDETVTAPDLVIGGESGVSGKLIPSGTVTDLKGLMVRLDYDWGYMVEADSDGSFHFPNVRPGKHRLTAYLPTNLRGDAGIGRAEIDAKAGEHIENLEIALDPLAVVRVRFLDMSGLPIEGITAGATWTRTGEGFWTEGTRSDGDGWATLYLYPNDTQYVGGFEFSEHGLVAEERQEVRPRPGETMNNIQIVMVPPIHVRGRVVTGDGTPFAGKDLVCRVDYADGIQRNAEVKSDASGRFEIQDHMPPGILRLALETKPIEFVGACPDPIEVKPGESKDFGDIVLAAVKFHSVTGKLLPSATFSNLAGLKIRLDLADWEPMVDTDADGKFVITKVPEGKHRLTAYLPFNPRTDRGVGHVDVEVNDDDLKDVELPLETLATIHMRIEDESGKPLEGIAAAAWWTPDHSGVFTEGTKSDKDGKATLYLYPNEPQYAGAHDWDGKYSLKAHTEVNLKPGEKLDSLRVVMKPSTATPS